jgi:hypothetical protein
MGVATVVCKLLNIVQPDYFYLGQKDGKAAHNIVMILITIRNHYDQLTKPYDGYVNVKARARLRALATYRLFVHFAMGSHWRFSLGAWAREWESKRHTNVFLGKTLNMAHVSYERLHGSR